MPLTCRPVRPSPRRIARHLLGRANLIRSTKGNRTGFEALLGAGGMQTIRDRQISRQLQVYYAQFDDMNELTNIVRQLRAEGVAIGHTLGLSAFGEMDADKLIPIVRGSPAYSAYLRTSREWAAIYLGTVVQQRQRALHLLGDIDTYLGKGGETALPPCRRTVVDLHESVRPSVREPVPPHPYFGRQ